MPTEVRNRAGRRRSHAERAGPLNRVSSHQSARSLCGQVC